MKSKITQLVIALLMIALTITIFNVEFSQLTTALKVSMTVICIAELLVVSTISLIPAITIGKGSVSILVNLYAFFMVVWSAAYPIGLHQNITAARFYIGLLIISLIMVPIIGFAIMGTSVSGQQNEKLEAVIKQKNDTKAIVKRCWISIQTDLDINHDVDTLRAMRILVDRILALPASRFPDNRIDEEMQTLTTAIHQLGNLDNKEKGLNMIRNQINDLTIYIK